MAEAGVRRVDQHLLQLGLDPLVLELEGSFEGLRLEAARELVPVGGECPLDRVAQHDEDLRVGQILGNPAGRVRMVDVIAAGVERHRVLARPARAHRCNRSDREVGLVPAPPLDVVDVEVVDALVVHGAKDRRVFEQRPEERGRAASLRAGEHEARHHATRRRPHPGGERHAAAKHLQSLGRSLLKRRHITPSGARVSRRTRLRSCAGDVSARELAPVPRPRRIAARSP